MLNINYKTEWYKTYKPDFKGFDDNLPEYWEMKYRDRYLQMLDFLPSKYSCHEAPIRILEVGCGTGRALSHFKAYGAEVVGVEPGDWAVENTRLADDEIIHDSFLEADIKGTFDIVYFEQVLSHMPDHVKALQKARELLCVGGIVAVEEPNEYNPLQMIIAKDKGIYWTTDDHCNYFSLGSIEDTLREFDVVYRSCTYPMELFYLQGIPYIGDEALGRRVHQMRYNVLSKLSYAQRRELKEGFARMGWGRDLFVIGKKGVQNG